MKKIITVLLVSISFVCLAHRGFHHGYGPHHHHHYSGWGHAGRYFWPGFIGGVVGSTVINTVAPVRPVVYTPAPVYVPTPRVWVNGHYETRYDPYGRPYQIWIPGYYR